MSSWTCENGVDLTMVDHGVLGKLNFYSAPTSTVARSDLLSAW